MEILNRYLTVNNVNNKELKLILKGHLRYYHGKGN